MRGATAAARREGISMLGLGSPNMAPAIGDAAEGAGKKGAAAAKGRKVVRLGARA